MQIKSFQLMRFFTATSLVAFAVLASVLFFSEDKRAAFLRQVQEQQLTLIKTVQQQFASEQEKSARRDLLSIHESGNVNLTRLFSNALWNDHFAPYVAKVSQIPAEHCRELTAKEEKQACYDEIGEQIMAFPEFAAINAKVFASMKGSTVFKIKVFDLRGITAYSSAHDQIGDDKINNAGWQGAMRGVPASELTHRDTFSAFEGVVENRDVISSYLPVYKPGTDEIAGVFEVYSDVTPFLAQINQTSEQIKRTAEKNQQEVVAAAERNQARIENLTLLTYLVVGGVLLLLYIMLFLLVRRAQTIMREQEDERQRSDQRLAQSEKMASLGQMVAGVAHQLNTPLAFSKNNIEMVTDALAEADLPLKVASRLATLAATVPEKDVIGLRVSGVRDQLDQVAQSQLDLEMIRQMLNDVHDGVIQMAEMVAHLKDFTRLDQSKVQTANLNKSLASVSYISRSVIPNSVELIEQYSDIPAIECNNSQLNQVFLNLINNAAQSIDGEGQVWVRTRTDSDGSILVEVEDSGSGIPADVLPKIFDLYYTTKPQGVGTGMGLHIAKDIVEQHGGQISVRTQIGQGSVFTVRLPAKSVAA